MKIEVSSAQRWMLTGHEDLYPIGVVVENLDNSSGSMIVQYEGNIWSAYWSGMGSMTVERFVSLCHVEHIVERLENDETKYPQLRDIVEAIKYAFKRKEK